MTRLEDWERTFLEQARAEVDAVPDYSDPNDVGRALGRMRADLRFAINLVDRLEAASDEPAVP